MGVYLWSHEDERNKTSVATGRRIFGGTMPSDYMKSRPHAGHIGSANRGDAVGLLASFGKVGTGFWQNGHGAESLEEL